MQIAKKVYCHGVLTSMRHVSAEWWQCSCGEMIRGLVPEITVGREYELERLIATQPHGDMGLQTGLASFDDAPRS
jgi:hypothetical protein